MVWFVFDDVEFVVFGDFGDLVLCFEFVCVVGGVLEGWYCVEEFWCVCGGEVVQFVQLEFVFCIWYIDDVGVCQCECL